MPPAQVPVHRLSGYVALQPWTELLESAIGSAHCFVFVYFGFNGGFSIVLSSSAISLMITVCPAYDPVEPLPMTRTSPAAIPLTFVICVTLVPAANLA